jgi:hypothetical protein
MALPNFLQVDVLSWLICPGSAHPANLSWVFWFRRTFYSGNCHTAKTFSPQDTSSIKQHIFKILFAAA